MAANIGPNLPNLINDACLSQQSHPQNSFSNKHIEILVPQVESYLKRLYILDLHAPNFCSLGEISTPPFPC